MRFLYILIPVALIVAALALTLESLRGPEEPLAGVAREELPRYEVTEATWVRLGGGGEPEFRAQAAGIDYFADGSARLETLSLDTLGGTASPWHLEATAGHMPPGERRIRLEGEVVGGGRHENRIPVVFETDQLWVDLLRRELRTEAEVSIRSDFRGATARGLRADFDGERVHLLNDVKVDYAPRS